VAVLFTPTEAVMYPQGFSTFVQEELVAAPLCGKGRPGHFRGVCTVVTKLLNQVGADAAWFGQKDAQQALVIRRMVRDLDIPVEVRLGAIVRDPDGLALSSRNRYLSAEERSRALSLRRALVAIERAFLAGTRDSQELLAAGEAELRAAQGVALEYLELVSTENLQPVIRVEGVALCAVAARVGPARLIDNTVLDSTRGRILPHM
jgi:pantoate--beta-alanine ligase